MPLPFPHGSGPGQIANGDNFDPNDTPGYPGGRFIGFGENATSAITNRAAWALSLNIDYIYQNYTAPKAVPAATGFTAGAGGVSDLVIVDSVFCGDSSYPPALAEGMLLLFAVLDGQYNTLTDSAGNEVRISSVTKYAETAYQLGFITNPDVTFCTVNPKTGDVVSDPYTIPEDTVVRVVYGSQSSLEGLPTDVFTRFKVMSGEEVPAGVLLLDGTLPMAGVLSMGGHDINNIASLGGYEGAPITLVDNLSGASSAALVGFTTIQNVGDGSIPVFAPDGFDGEGTGPLQNFISLDLSTDIVRVTNANHAGPFQTPLFSDDDYIFKEDFASLDSYTLSGSSMQINTWLSLSGTTGAMLAPPGPPTLYGRSTNKALVTTSAVSSYIALYGPALFDLQGNFFHALAGFAVDTLSNPSGEAYTLKFGFNVTADPATTPCAFVSVDTEGEMYFHYSDGSTYDAVDLGPMSAQHWYDVGLVFGTATITVTLNGVAAYVLESFPLLASIDWSFTAMRIDKTDGSAASSVMLDYTELYSQGHQPRPYISAS